MLPFAGYNMGEYFSTLASHAQPDQTRATYLPCELVPPRRRTASSSGPDSAKTCECSNGSSTAAMAASPVTRPRSAGLLNSKTSIPKASISPRNSSIQTMAFNTGRVETGSSLTRRTLPQPLRSPTKGTRLSTRIVSRTIDLSRSFKFKNPNLQTYLGGRNAYPYATSGAGVLDE